MLLEIVQFVGVIYRLGFKLSYNFIKNKNQHFNIILKVGKQIQPNDDQLLFPNRLYLIVCIIQNNVQSHSSTP